jgi:hypothetical protein
MDEPNAGAKPDAELEPRPPAADRENEAKVFSALATLPDNAVRELQPGELQQYNVIRVADEILVDLMRSAGGITYEEAAHDLVVRECRA